MITGKTYTPSTRYPSSSTVSIVLTLCGDFNSTPQDIVDTEWDILEERVIPTPSNTTATCTAGLSGSLIDYGIGSRHFDHLIYDVLPYYDVPVKNTYWGSPCHQGTTSVLDKVSLDITKVTQAE